MFLLSRGGAAGISKGGHVSSFERGGPFGMGGGGGTEMMADGSEMTSHGCASPLVLR